jgi:hypothetical protein
MYVQFVGMGMTAAACVAVGFGAGYWIGEATGAGTAVTFAGLIVGAAAAVAATWFKVRRYL